MVSVGMTDLVEFLRARLDETRQRGETLQALADAMRPRGFPESADLIAETGAQLLADVEAKRRIVEECENTLAHGDTEGPNAYGLAWVIARYLALPHAAHPDYDPSWRPAEVTA